VAVGGDKVNDNGEKIVANAGEFMVGVDVANAKTAGRISVDGGPKTGENGRALAVRIRENSAVTNVKRDCMEERDLLDIEEIGTQGDVEVVGGNGGRNWDGFKLGNMRCSGALRSGALEKRNVGAINNEGASSVLRGNVAVAEVIPFENALEIRFRWAAEKAVEVTSRIGIKNLSGSKKLLLIGDGGDQSVMCNRRLRLVRIKNEQS
jgi:hypothetical protein